MSRCRRPCPREEELLRRLAAGREVPAALRAHVDGCQRCRSARRTVEGLAELARAAGEVEAPGRPGSGLPAAAELWRTAALRRRLREGYAGAGRLGAPLRVTELVCGSLAAVAAGAVTPALAHRLEAVLPPDPATAVVAAAGIASLLVLSLGGLGISYLRRR